MLLSLRRRYGRGVPRRLDEGRHPNPNALGMIGNKYTVDWSRYMEAELTDSVETGLPKQDRASSASVDHTVPEDFKLHPRVRSIVEDRQQDGRGRTGHGLGLCRDHGLCLVAERRISTCA
jgi:2-oxoglutarate dehydrogenase complex dehydrogenase (E1) component-like enzyme